MTQKSQHRNHTGKRGAAQRKARREGYAYRKRLDITNCPPGLVEKCLFLATIDNRYPHLNAAFRHGAQDWQRKHHAR